MQDGEIGLDLEPVDYEWATQRLCAAGVGARVVSVLEGGYGCWDEAAGRYNRRTLADACAAHARALLAHAGADSSEEAP